MSCLPFYVFCFLSCLKSSARSVWISSVGAAASIERELYRLDNLRFQEPDDPRSVYVVYYVISTCITCHVLCVMFMFMCVSCVVCFVCLACVAFGLFFGWRFLFLFLGLGIGFFWEINCIWHLV